MFWWSPEDERELRKCPQNQSEFPHFQADLVSWSGSSRSFSPQHLPVNPRFRRYRDDWSQAESTVPIPKWLQILCRKTCKGSCFCPPFYLKMGRAQETEDSLGAWEVTENSRSKQPVWTRSKREATVNTGRKEFSYCYILLFKVGGSLKIKGAKWMDHKSLHLKLLVRSSLLSLPCKTILESGKERYKIRSQSSRLG